MTLQTLILRYAAFAIVATLSNLTTQRLILQFGETAAHFAGGVGAGTIVGLVFKYMLDKRWIYFDIETSVKNHGKKFSLYMTTGCITTAIFWGTETTFWLTWGTDMMRELGAILGLSVGYVVKYNLDRRFVFTDGRLAAST